MIDMVHEITIQGDNLRSEERSSDEIAFFASKESLKNTHFHHIHLLEVFVNFTHNAPFLT